jgi:hypothetical protein
MTIVEFRSALDKHTGVVDDHPRNIPVESYIVKEMLDADKNIFKNTIVNYYRSIAFSGNSGFPQQ